MAHVMPGTPYYAYKDLIQAYDYALIVPGMISHKIEWYCTYPVNASASFVSTLSTLLNSPNLFLVVELIFTSEQSETMFYSDIK
jgi:hypothetical protein